MGSWHLNLCQIFINTFFSQLCYSCALRTVEAIHSWETIEVLGKSSFLLLAQFLLATPPTLTPALSLDLLLFKFVHHCCFWTAPCAQTFHPTAPFRTSSWVYRCTGEGLFAVYFLSCDCQKSSYLISKEWLMFALLLSATSSPGSTSGRWERTRFLLCTNPGFHQCPTLEASWLSWVSGSFR